MVDAAAGFVAWLGVSLVVVADGRRGLALGTALAAGAAAILAVGAAGWAAAGVLAAGGAVSALRRNSSGPPGWDILPAGSTPRLVLCVATGLLVFWIAAGVMTGPGASVRFAVIVVVGLAAARVFANAAPPILLTAVSLLALAMGLAASTGDTQDLWPFVAAGLLVATIPWLPVRAVRAS